jgi:hypothetical protein
MRPCLYFFIVLICCLAAQLVVLQEVQRRAESALSDEQQMLNLSARFGLTDLCVATDARYIRHLSVTDPLAPYMDHPGAIEYFPTGSFWVPVR